MTDVWVLATEQRKQIQYTKFIELLEQMPTLFAIDPQKVRTQLFTMLSMLYSHLTLISIQQHKSPELTVFFSTQKEVLSRAMQVIEEQAKTSLQELDLQLLLKNISEAEQVSLHIFGVSRKKDFPKLDAKRYPIKRVA
ncbi:MAG: hypothetical protein Q7K43_03845 [Candidatus Woesearchaeota archaeon]|nr:hypothetical protein [Candidatus Woesearchaeota archaeon]